MHNTELELKYALSDPEQGHLIVTDPYIEEKLLPSSRQTLPMRAIYYDDENRSLAALRAGYRVRKEGEELISTLKWSVLEEEGGFSQRLEYNVPVETESPEVTVFLPLLRRDFPEEGRRPSGLTELVGLLTSGLALKPLFISDCQRHLGELRFRDSLLEISFDIGTLTAGECSEPVCELECELKEGTAEDLMAFGEELTERFSLKPLSDSKLKRGLALAERSRGMCSERT